MSDVPFTMTLEAISGGNGNGSGHSVTCKLGGNVPKPKEGGGGWEEIQLPKRSSALVWRGFGLLKIDVPVVFDGTADEVAVSSEYETLRHMYRPVDREAPPPIVAVSVGGGTGIDTIPYLDEIGEWVVSELEWGDAIEDAQGHRIQQSFVVTLTEYAAEPRLKPSTGAKKKPRTRRYVIERKDVAGGLGKLASRFHLKSWRVLAEAQHPPRKDPRLTEKDIGKTLIVPLGGIPGLVVLSSSAQPTTGG